MAPFISHSVDKGVGARGEGARERSRLVAIERDDFNAAFEKPWRKRPQAPLRDRRRPSGIDEATTSRLPDLARPPDYEGVRHMLRSGTSP